MPRRFRHGKRWLQERSADLFQRMTVPRQAILEVLERSAKHLSAEDVYFEVHQDYPDIGLTTIYRNLELLAHKGLVTKLNFGEGRSRYELTEGPEGPLHHHHLVCTRCGKIVDYTDYIDDEVELLRQTEKGLSQKYDFKITNHIIQFYGLCAACRRAD